MNLQGAGETERSELESIGNPLMWNPELAKNSGTFLDGRGSQRESVQGWDTPPMCILERWLASGIALSNKVATSHMYAF